MYKKEGLYSVEENLDSTPVIQSSMLLGRGRSLMQMRPLAEATHASWLVQYSHMVDIVGCKPRGMVRNLNPAMSWTFQTSNNMTEEPS